MGEADALSEFYAEAEEIVGRLSANIGLIERRSDTSEVLDELYRDTHTLKGTSQLFGFQELGLLNHAMEACLAPVRKQKAPPGSALLEALYKSVDAIDHYIARARVGEAKLAEATRPLLTVIPSLLECAADQFAVGFDPVKDSYLEEPTLASKAAQAQAPAAKTPAAPPPTLQPPPARPQTPATVPAAASPPAPTVAPTATTTPARAMATPAARAQPAPTPPRPAARPEPAKAPRGSDGAFVEQILSQMGGSSSPSESSPAAGPHLNGGGDSGGAPGADSAATDTSIRVQVSVLDRLMNLAGEMVLVRNQVLQYSNRTEDLELLALSQRLDLVTSDLQGQVMRTRMQPIGNVVGKFQRLIRDLSKDLGKQIDLTIQGKDTELDKTLLEAIKDPLTHIVRNSCDHGIETVAERKKLGKPETGHVLISAYHEGGQVIIEISDDGKGLNRKKIVAKALERSLVTPERVPLLSDREIMNLIFLPGFSTAEQVSSVSGRGVGMDVVRTNIERIGGSVDLESAEGKGSTIRLRIPLTLAIVPAMLVKCAGQTYAIPQVKLVELVRVDGSEERAEKDAIRILQGKPVYELRGKLLPLVDLREVLGLRKATGDFDPSGITNIAVLNAEGESFGLVVEEVIDMADIVVKPLSKFLKALGLYSAATILGTGDVALILDPMGIAKAVNLASRARRQEGAFAEAATGARQANADAQEYLLFKTSGTGKYAVPLCLVSRLEELKADQIEYSGRQPIVQYRNVILPLIEINAALGFSGSESVLAQSRTGQAPVPTVVIQKAGRLVGMVVDAILDVATVETVIDDTVKDRPGILGNVVLGKEVVTVIDALNLVEGALTRSPSAGEKSDPKEALVEAQQAHAKPRVLYAEDVAFFRRQVTKLLSEHGFDVTTVEDGKAALEILRRTDVPEFQLILSDIEMPRMNGNQLAQAARKLPKYQKTPLIALTTRCSQKDIEEGKQSGFDHYLEKLNPDKLMESIMALLKEGRGSDPQAGLSASGGKVA